MKNSSRSIGSSRWMMPMSRSIEAGVSPRKPENVAGVGERTDGVPCLQHGAVFGDLILAFLRALERVGVDVLQTDEHAIDARAAGLLDEAAHLVRHGVDLRDDVECAALPARASRSGDRRSLPSSALRARLSSVMKKLWTPCARLSRTMRSTSSALRLRDLRPCTLMMVQKLHRNGQPRPASKLVRSPEVRRTTSSGRNGTAAPSRPGRSFMKL